MDVKDELKKVIKKALKELNLPKVEVQIEHPDNQENGDYSSNIAMTMFGSGKWPNVAKGYAGGTKAGRGKHKTPLELAEEIVKKLKSIIHDSKFIILDKVEVAPPGFINFWLSKDYFSKQFELALKAGERYPKRDKRGTSFAYGSSEAGKGKKIVIDYSGPNIAKRFSIGHLRSTIIGQSIYNIYQFLGYKAIGDNHLGDWGTQFGAIIAEIKNLKLKIKNLTIDNLERLYVEFNKKAQDDPKLWYEARAWFKKLEDGDKEVREIWQACVEISLKEFNQIYALLNVEIDHAYGESFYEDKMQAIIKELKDKKLAFEDQGALIIKYPKQEFPPGIILKSDGGTTYLTRDLATIKFRLKVWNPDLVIYEVGIEQSLYFKQFFAAVKLLGWAESQKFVHVKHGLYLGENGKKFSTRRGETVKLVEVLREAIERAKKLGAEHNDPSDDVARQVGIGAVKYFDLSHSPESNIIFSWEKMFLLTGNSGPYLQYTYARAQSVLRKAGVSDNRNTQKTQNARRSDSQKIGYSDGLEFRISELSEFSGSLKQEELALLRTFYRFPEVVEAAAEQFAPNIICNFLFDLASKYNLMYNNLVILGNDFRLALTLVTANILKTGLGLLGIQAPERM